MTHRGAWLRDEMIRRADTLARRRGMGRREFLASSMGTALALTVINELGCNGSKASPVTPPGASCGDGGFAQGSGPYVIPPEATCNPSARIPACADFIFDMQTYCFDAGEWRARNIVEPTFLNFVANCPDETNKLDCFNPQHYAELLFVESDTTMAALTGVPASSCFPERSLLGNPPIACGLPLTNEGMRAVRDWINAKAGSQRCINQFLVMPNDFLERQVEAMYAAVSDPGWRCGGWSVYPSWTSDTYRSAQGDAQGFFMTDPLGVAFVEAGLKLGVPNFAIHKGPPGPGYDLVHDEPTDIGPIASMFPQGNFIVYESAIGAGAGSANDAGLAPTPTENVPYSASDPMPLGVNMLIRSLITSGIVQDPDVTGRPVTPHNVYAEMGLAWGSVMTDPNEAQHYIGKLLKYLGPANICWGTRAILAGSPQALIDAFRAFTITAQYQEMYGYPALTPAIKAQIFGLNAARIYRVDAATPRCKVGAGSFA